MSAAYRTAARRPRESGMVGDEWKKAENGE